MNGKDFLSSSWMEDAQKTETAEKVRKEFSNWATRVSNTGILERARKLYDFFLSPDISGIRKTLVVAALLYVISPLDLIPDFIPIAGWLDDLGVASFALKYIFATMDDLKDSMPNGRTSVSVESQWNLLTGEIPGTGNEDFQFGDNKEFESKGIGQTSSELMKCLNELSDIAKSLRFDHVFELSRIADRIDRCRILKVAVVGRYSTGKSTLINALLNRKLLPSSPVPTTKAITYIMKGRSEALYSEDASGGILIHDKISDLQNLGDKPICAAKKIMVSISDFPFSNLTIVDTPGLEESDSASACLTQEEIPKTDALVVLFDANYMKNSREFEFVSSLLKGDRGRRLFVVLNKVDGKTDKEIDELKRECTSLLSGCGVRNASLYAVCAKDGDADPRFKMFHEELFSFLSNEVWQEAVRHASAEMKTCSRALLAFCSNAISEARKDSAVRRVDAKKAQRSMVEVTEKFEAQKNAFSRKMEKYRSQFKLDLSYFFDRLKASVSKEIQGASLDSIRNTDDISGKLKHEIANFVDSRMAELDSQLKTDLASAQVVIREGLASISIPLDVKVPNYAVHGGLVLPTMVFGTYFLCGVFSSGFIMALIAASFGRSFFESAITRWLGSIGVNQVREKIIGEVRSKLDACLQVVSEKSNDAICSVEKELLKSFDVGCAQAVVPYESIAGSQNDLEVIRNCHDRLIRFVEAS